MNELSDFEVAREVWKGAIDLQKHSNDILFRLRSFFFLFLAAAATFGSKTSDPAALGFPEDLLLVTPALGIYILDRFYYHLLLVGAVHAARRVEVRYPALRLSEVIREANVSSTILFARRGRQKVTLFYAVPIVAAVVLLSRGALGGRAWGAGAVTAVAFAAIETIKGALESRRFALRSGD